MSAAPHKDPRVPWAQTANEPGRNKPYPVIIEDPSRFPFKPGEADDYHEATDDELANYQDYYDGDEQGREDRKAGVDLSTQKKRAEWESRSAAWKEGWGDGYEQG